MRGFRATVVLQLCLALALFTGCPPEDDPGTDPPDTGADTMQPDEDMGMPDTTTGGDDMATGCATAGCPGDLQCDPASGECVACLDASHCMDPTAPVCRDGECAGCENDDECTDETAAHCAADGSCVACTADEHCPGANPFCGDDNQCDQCAESADCPATAPACSEGTCRTCADVECDDDELARSVAGAFCRNGVLLEGRYEDIPSVERSVQGSQALMCTETFGLDPGTYEPLFDAIADGRLAVDEAALEACLMNDPGMACGASDLLVPQVADGDACLASLECISGVCDQSMTCPGTCAARGAVGDACVGDSDCRTTLTCIGGSCAELPALGETCETRCGEGWCDTGTCVSLQAAGEPCSNNTQCESVRCDLDANVCLALPEAGEECISFVCQDQGRCWQDTCQEPQPVGSACDVTAQCARGLRCVDESCVQILLPGEPCTESGHCARGTGCIGGRCRTLPDVGEACSPETGCLRGECDQGTCENLGAGDACGPETTFPYDIFDPCGDATTCLDVDGNMECVSDLAEGDACGRRVTARCELGTSCERDQDDALVCEALCTADSI